MNSQPYSATPNSGILPTGSWFSTPEILPKFSSSFNENPMEMDSEKYTRSKIAKLLTDFRQRLRPWSTEFFRVSKFGWPLNIATIPLRIKQNLEHFFINYLCLTIILMVSDNFKIKFFF